VSFNSIRIQTHDFDLAQEYQQLRELSSTVGAVVTFTGLVRDFQFDSSIDSLSLQHYPGMTETLLQEIVDQANQRWQLIGGTVIHRVGELLPRDQIVFVGVASQHRADAFEAAQFLMDYLKTKATFWKQVSQDGQQHWVESKDSDTDAASRWNSKND
jgi:molybdopterin synthase catalytic subunit